MATAQVATSPQSTLPLLDVSYLVLDISRPRRRSNIAKEPTNPEISRNGDHDEDSETPPKASPTQSRQTPRTSPSFNIPENAEIIEISDDEPEGQLPAEGSRPDTTRESPSIKDEEPFQESDEKHEPSFTPGKLPIGDIIANIKGILEKEDFSDKQGYAYIFSDPENKSPCYKIGSAIRTETRAKGHQKKCKLLDWESQKVPDVDIKQYVRLERLAQGELINLKCDANCICEIKHVEYFWGSSQTGQEILKFWSKWLIFEDPYDEENILSDFWKDRLERFRLSGSPHFICGADECVNRDPQVPACQDCLRTGWKLWAEPTPEDRFEYICRKTIPWIWTRQCLQKLCQGNEDTCQPYVEFIGPPIKFVKGISGLTPTLVLMFIRQLYSVLMQSMMNGWAVWLADLALLVILGCTACQHVSFDKPAEPRTKAISRSPRNKSILKQTPRLNTQPPATPEKSAGKSEKNVTDKTDNPSSGRRLGAALGSEDPFGSGNGEEESPLSRAVALKKRPGNKRVSLTPLGVVEQSLTPPSASGTRRKSAGERRKSQYSIRSTSTSASTTSSPLIL